MPLSELMYSVGTPPIVTFPCPELHLFLIFLFDTSFPYLWGIILWEAPGYFNIPEW